ncbi:MAG: SDR family oxidoreductase [Bryobacteraceae bacterium]|nr:SDR family oxidoreductase [Bryobacteraceae bacterium]
MRVLVTGHRGYIGAVITPMIASAGHQVTGLDIDYYRNCDFGTETVRGFGAQQEINKDVREITRDDLKGIDAIVHLAALCNDPLSDLNPDLTLDINYRATLKLARRALDAGVRRFLFSSSCSMYGSAGDELVTESAPFRPLTIYARSKVFCEQEISALASDRFSPVFLRNATAYGVSPRLRLDLVLNNLTASAMATGRVYLKSDGTPWRPLVHIEDIGRAFLAALEAPIETVHNQAFNIGANSENYQMRELAEFVRDAVPGARIEYAPDAGPDLRCYRVDFSKARTALPGFAPRWTAREGAVELAEAFRRHPLNASDLEGAVFNRVKRIRRMLANDELTSELRWNLAPEAAYVAQPVAP